MTILFFARRFYPLVGGVEKHVMEISKRLVQKGHRVIVITEKTEKLAKHENLLLKDAKREIEIYRIYAGKENWFKKFRVWFALFQLNHVINSADVIHVHDIFYWYLPFRFLLPKKKVYMTFHGYEGYPIKKKAIFARKIAEKLSHGNICIGDFISKWYGTKPTVVSYGAVDIGLKTYDSRLKMKNESAVFIGRLDDQTGILMYVKAVKLLRKKFPKFELLALGDGPFKSRIAKDIKVTGFINDPEKYFPKYHFAFISRYLAILEAFAAKKLVFALYDNPVKEDYLRLAPFSKFIVIVKDPKELSHKVTHYLKNPNKEKELTENAFQWVQQQSWEKMVSLYVKLWKGAV